MSYRRSEWLPDPNRVPTLEEARRIFRYARRRSAEGRKARSGFRRARNGHLVLFGLATAARISEILAVDLGDVRLGQMRNFVRLPVLKRRTDKAPTIDVELLPEEAADLALWIAWLTAHGADPQRSPLFPGRPPDRTGPVPPRLGRKGATLAVQRLYADAGVDLRKGLGAHALRHAKGLLAYEASGHDPRAVQHLLRHASRASSEAYSRLDPAKVEGTRRAVYALLADDPPAPSTPPQPGVATPSTPPSAPHPTGWGPTSAVLVVACPRCGANWYLTGAPPTPEAVCGNCRGGGLVWRAA